MISDCGLLFWATLYSNHDLHESTRIRNVKYVTGRLFGELINDSCSLVETTVGCCSLVSEAICQ